MPKDENILHAGDCDCQECLDKWASLMSDVVFPSSNEATIKTNYEWIIEQLNERSGFDIDNRELSKVIEILRQLDKEQTNVER